MRTVKFQISEVLWEKFYRAFPGHGERSNLLRKIVRHIIINKPQHTFFEEAVGDSLLQDMTEEGEQE
jgi:hypothetical protein